MLVRRIALLTAAAGMAISPIASAAAAPVPARVGAPVTAADYQDGNSVGPMAVIVVLVLVLLFGLATIGGDGEPDSP